MVLTAHHRCRIVTLNLVTGLCLLFLPFLSKNAVSRSQPTLAVEWDRAIATRGLAGLECFPLP